jgi:Predicted membrane protein (DUF2207)
MFEFPNVVDGYTPAILALVFVTAYFALVVLIVRRPGPQSVSVPRYQPPPGISPAVAAWLLERDLSRAVAAALVNMAAKGYLKIEQCEDFCSVTQLQSQPTPQLEPEEDALSYRLFHDYDCFDFDEVTPHLIEGVRAFQWALQDTTYFSSNAGLLSFPAWIVSGLGVFLALANTHFWSKLDRGSAKLIGATAVATFVSFVVAVATLRGTVEKITTRLPGSTAPQRPWTGADTRPLTYLCVSLGGIALFGLLSSTTAALIILGFLVINGFFFHSLQGLTPAGRKALTQLSDYRKFLSEVDADVISRLHVSDHVPAQLRPEDAYAVAFHLDLGWGEQFVTSITDLVELAAISKPVEGQIPGLSAP